MRRPVAPHRLPSSDEFDALRRGTYARGEPTAGLFGADILLTTSSSRRFINAGDAGTLADSWLRIDAVDERREIYGRGDGFGGSSSGGGDDIGISEPMPSIGIPYSSSTTRGGGRATSASRS
jgi:hypothetical protein